MDFFFYQSVVKKVVKGTGSAFCVFVVVVVVSLGGAGNSLE